MQIPAGSQRDLMGLHDFTFYDIIRRNAEYFGEKVAWHEIEQDRTISFRLFKEDVDCLAGGLRKAGLKRGDRIGLLGKNCLEYFMLYGAASALGAIVLPVNWRLSPDEICFNLNDCEPRLLFAGEEFQGIIKESKGKLKSVDRFYNLNLDRGGFTDIGSLMNPHTDFQPDDVSSDDGFAIMYTAAVEGRPRGALLSHNNIILASMHFGDLFDLKPNDVHLNFLPLFHVGGLFMVITCFHNGALNINARGFDAERAVDIIHDSKVSIMMEFSPMLSSILDQKEKSGKNLDSLRAVAGIDSRETIERYQQITGGNFYSLYGQTETSCVVFSGAYNERPGSAGRMMPLADVRIVDDYDCRLPTEKVGEIVVRGPMVFKGYWNKKGDTDYTFRDGWHHTGDMGYLDSDGFLWYAGRKPEKELIKPGGENVYPAEVEKIILQHPFIEKCAVFGVPDPKWKEGIKAVCQLKTGKNLEEKGLIDFVGERIARYKRPQYVEFVDEMPLKEDGSVDRIKVKEKFGRAD
ncbi:MAG: AMP-binding protein [Deltaproteobacteria bacterium]|nr:AMP-binding protein [Deltaproteobacteria bacterium]